MDPFVPIIGVGWVVLWLYWLVSAFRAKKGTSGNFKQFVAVRAGILVLVVVVALLRRRAPHFSLVTLNVASEQVRVVGLILFLLGLALALSARYVLGRNWGMPMTQKEEPELVASGPYRYVRHPIYSGILLMALGSAIDVNNYWMIVFVVAAVYFVHSALTEERLMAQQFPEAYPPYKSKTKMLIPFIL